MAVHFKAHIRIDPGGGDTPYVRGYRSCGRHGVFMHLTPKYILDESFASWFGTRGEHAYSNVHVIC